MAVKLSPETEAKLETLMQSTGMNVDDLIESALAAFSGRESSFWERIERLDSEADDDVASGRVRPVTVELLESLRSLVARPRP